MDRQPVAEEMDSQEGNVGWERLLQIGQPRETVRAVACITVRQPEVLPPPTRGRLKLTLMPASESYQHIHSIDKSQLIHLLYHDMNHMAMST